MYVIGCLWQQLPMARVIVAKCNQRCIVATGNKVFANGN